MKEKRSEHSRKSERQDESNTSTNFSIIVQESGFFATVFGGQSPDPRLRAAPKGNLGPRYSVVYTVPGPTTTVLRPVDVPDDELDPAWAAFRAHPTATDWRLPVDLANWYLLPEIHHPAM